MKATVLNSLTAKSSANFEKNVSKLLPAGVNEIYLSYAGMERVGNGSYNYVLGIQINNGEHMKLTEFTHSSPAWDSYQDLEDGSRALDNFKKGVALMIIENCKQEIIDLLNDANED